MPFFGHWSVIYVYFYVYLLLYGKLLNMSRSKSVSNETDCNSPKKRRNREATQTAILEAFTRVVERDGLSEVSPTKVMEESGYSKPLLYDYFGNMKGLVQAWFDRNQIWPNHQFPESIGNEEEFQQCIKDFLLSTASALRNNRCAQEFLSAELTRNWEYQDILKNSRERWLQENMAELIAHPEIRQTEIWNLLFVTYSAINYLVLRALAGTPHVGLKLDTDADWEDAMFRVESVIDDLMLACNVKRTVNKKSG